MKLRIGPAGLGPVKTAIETLEKYHKLGFRACEIAFTYSVYIKDEKDAIAIGKRAKELDIYLSIHAPYFINLNSSEKDKVEASKKRILECCRVGHLLQATRIVFHPGYYGKDKDRDKELSYDNIKIAIRDILDQIKKNNWNVSIAPETMGKVNVFGSLEEISELVRDTECGFCIDFAHILAREKKVDYARVKELFPSKVWHTHFSGIVYGDKGEKHHVCTEESAWKELLSNLPKDKDREIVIINESPTMIPDCIAGLKIAKSLGF